MHLPTALTAFIVATALAAPTSINAISNSTLAVANDNLGILGCFPCFVYYLKCRQTQASDEICRCLTSPQYNGRCRTDSCRYKDC
ncbi:hypothetical protein AA0118_g2267 [Alternaria tenuissima]|nr:hypothetical protein AA0118_g2267 [Alternaria tenuissima]RYN90576.1 hypothetical protein AA0120_g5875 [Alternaria tenuissima]